MSIFARDLEVVDYRNFPAYVLALDPGLTVLVGHNAAGKTNLVEALQLLTSGRSFRKPSPAELVREGAESCRLNLKLEGDGRVIDLGCSVEGGKRSFSRNGKRCRAAGVRGVVPSVLFCPDDLDMVKRGARVRREALDSFGIQLNENYAQLLSSYERTLEQRNALLKERYCTPTLLETWNESLAVTGAALTVHRIALLARIRERLVETYERITTKEKISVSYLPSWSQGCVPIAAIGSAPADDERRAAIDTISSRLMDAYSSREDEEIRRGMTLTGPHRDEVVFEVNGRSARSFASQGQQRSIVLAWKMAEVEVTRDILGRPPLLLLDDVMSELDAMRRDAFLSCVGHDVQTVITTTNLGYFNERALHAAKVVSMGES